MRIAVYHCLPPGGARRMLREILRRSGATHDYELFELDLGPDARLDDLGGAVKPPHVVPVPGPKVKGALRPAVDVARVVTAERRVSSQIDAGGFDLAFVNPSQFTQAPTVLSHLRTPSVYLIQEPRRRSLEAGYRTTLATGAGLSALPRRAATALFDREVGRLDRRAVRAAGTLVCNSAFSAESIFRAYGRSARVCHAGVDTDLFIPTYTPDSSVAAVPEEPYGRSFVLCVGALDPTKGHDLVVAALGLIDEARRPALHIVFERSAPGYPAVLRDTAAQSGVDLFLHPGITDVELVALYRAAATTVCAARLEPFGLTPLESISSGTPVVAVSEGSYRETVTNGLNGELVERRPEAIAAAIDRVVTATDGLGPWSLRSTVVPSWGWDKTVARLLDVFDESVA